MADVVQTAANVRFSANARMEQRTAGESVVIGQPIYFDATAQNKVKKADADTAAAGLVRGLAAGTADLDQPVLVCYEDPDLTPGFVTAAGTPYFSSVTAGAIADAKPASAKYSSVLMIGKAGNKASFRPLNGVDPVP